jgi:cytochrome d ubiquinol oxidase subunit I
MNLTNLFSDPLQLSRIQFAVTTLFHMLWPLISIGLALYMVIMEILWLRTKNDLYYRHIRFWSMIFLLTFGIGVASGIPLEMEFGTNWSRFSEASGEIMGNILGFEAAMAFALEAAFLAIFVFGWKRVSRGVHLFSTIMVFFGATLSAFWIMGANSWMQIPAGTELRNGEIVITNYFKAIFNPGLLTSFTHIWAACIETTVFLVAGISAWFILRKRHADFFMRSFKVALVIAIFVTPTQIFLGDRSARAQFVYQPAKAAAMEANWHTNPPGTGASWALIAIPNRAQQKNDFAIEIPNLLSLLADRTFKGQVTGLSSIPRENQPPIVLPFYAFRIMVGLAFIMFFMMLWAVWYWYRKRLGAGSVPNIFWKTWLIASPIGYLATEMGWVVREVGRQPWIIYNLMRTSEGVSNLTVSQTRISLALFLIIYLTLLGLFFFFVFRIMLRGPDLTSPVPVSLKERKKTTSGKS